MTEPDPALPAVPGGDPDEMPDLGALLGGLGGSGGLDGLLEQAQNMMAAAAEAAEATVEGTSGGGAVRVQVNGRMEFSAVSIDPAVVDPDDVGLLEDLVLAALRDASTKLADNAGSSSMGLGDFGSLFGGA